MHRADVSSEKSKGAGPAGSATGRILVGGVWTMVERIAAQFSQLFIFIAAARILGPAEFGVFALVSACAILVLRVSEMGWAPFIMSWSGDSRVPGQVLLVAVLCGAVFAAIGLAAGWGLDAFLGADRVGDLVQLFAVWVFLATISSAQKGIMIWRQQLRWSASAETLGEMTGFAVALWALFGGWGVFSLVFGRISYQCVHLAISICATRTLPSTGLTRAVLRELAGFSRQILFNRMIVNFRIYAATFVIGAFLGPASVGYYRAAERLVGALSEIIDVPTQVLAWSLFRQSRDQHGGTVAGFQRRANLFFRLLLGFSIPAFIWLAVVAGDLLTTLIGPEWLPALPVVAILALSRVITGPAGPMEPILSLAGELRRILPFVMMTFTFTVALTLLGAQAGLLAVAWAQVGASVLVLAGAVRLYRNYAQIDLLEVWRKALDLVIPILSGSAVLILLQAELATSDIGPLLRLTVVSLAALAVYGITCVLLVGDLRRMIFARAVQTPAE